MGARKDLTGTRREKLVVIRQLEERFTGSDGRPQIQWLCLCDCGNERIVTTRQFNHNKPTSCGCWKKPREIQNLTGEKYGKLTVLKMSEERYPAGNRMQIQWDCQCECGNTISVTTNSWNSRAYYSCGCWKSHQKDYTGETYEKLTIVERLTERYKNKDGATQVQWLAKCDCGNDVLVTSSQWSQKMKTSCGCWSKRVHMLKKGERFGKLTVEKYLGNIEEGRHMWLCICDCGNERKANVSLLRSRKDIACKYCGYHMKSDTLEYRSWCGMIRRCTNPNDSRYSDYGGRGIKVHDKWMHSFENFLKDMGEKPSSEYSLDRKDTNGHYHPDNCRWATDSTQVRNRRILPSNTSGTTGVDFDNWNNAWRVRITVDGNRILVGHFVEKEAAKKARKEAELKYWGQTYDY